MKQRLLPTLLFMILLAGVTSNASATFIIGGTGYYQTGPAEVMTASFLAADGGVSSGLYNGLIQVTVSGTGQSLGTAVNDAFYVITGGPYHDPQWYQLAFNTSTLFPLQPARDAKNFIRYDVDAGVEVTPAYVPAYRPDHTYSIILDTGTTTLSNLHFGVSNGIFSDNTGAYTLSIQQLAPVPEPTSLGLLALGLVGVGARMRRRR